ncbi:hypothetical protein V8E55_009147 [Tylopilus felleus]
MGQVKFFVLVNNETVERVSARLDDLLFDIFISLKAVNVIPGNIPYKICEFYRLNSPVLFINNVLSEGDTFLKQAKQACLEESNRMQVEPMTTKVALLAETISSEHAYLVIDFPDPFLESLKIIERLRQDHAPLFKRLQIKVKSLGRWQADDVERNLQGGILRNSVNELPPEFGVIQDALAQKRVYNDTDDVTARPDLQHARLYKTQFDYVFTASATPSPTVINDREFAAFHQLLRCFHKDVERIASNTSSSLKTSNFIVHFVQPPFFSEIDNRSRGFQEKSWGFPIFVDSIKSPGVFRKFTPRSDWMVISPQFRIPFVISEVISDETENSRYRMLIEATVLARAGRFLLQCNSEKRFFVVAIYVNANMVASRYIVMDTGGGGPENEEASKPVSIHRQDFDLRQVDQEVDFLREMYNLATQMYAISDHLDQDKEKSLLELKDAAGDVLTLNSAEDQTRTIDSAITTSSTQGTAGSRGFQDEDDLGVFEAEDIQNVLHQMNYKIEFIPWGHPQLAAIVSKSDEMYRYLKFVESENELKVLRYLSEIKSPSNHTISGVQFWPVQGGAVISMPVAGGWLTSLDNPHEQLWSVALQLVEGVVFMHENNVAHMDLKPQNVIIPPEGGHLSIIDFSVSIRVRSADARYSGVVGTEDYIAPEVRKGNYKPMLADLWSCGRTLEELCAYCHSSPERTELLEIASRLMDRDPEARPKMSDVLEQMALTRRGKDRVVPPISATAPPASPSSLCVA